MDSFDGFASRDLRALKPNSATKKNTMSPRAAKGTQSASGPFLVRLPGTRFPGGISGGVVAAALVDGVGWLAVAVDCTACASASLPIGGPVTKTSTRANTIVWKSFISLVV